MSVRLAFVLAVSVVGCRPAEDTAAAAEALRAAGEPLRADWCLDNWFIAGEDTCVHWCGLAEHHDACGAEAQCERVLLTRLYARDGKRLDVPVQVAGAARVPRFSHALVTPYHQERVEGEWRLVSEDAAVKFRCFGTGAPPYLDGVQPLRVPLEHERELIQWNIRRMADAGLDPLGKPL